MREIQTAYLRVRNDRDRPSYTIERFGPKTLEHPTVNYPCAVCGEGFRPGDWTCLVALGPGDDPDQQDRARNHLYYTAVALEAHWECVTGHREGEE